MGATLRFVVLCTRRRRRQHVVRPIHPVRSLVGLSSHPQPPCITHPQTQHPRPQVPDDPDKRARFLSDFERERTIVRGLRHPNLCRFYGVSTPPGHAALVCAWVGWSCLFRLDVVWLVGWFAVTLY